MRRDIKERLLADKRAAADQVDAVHKKRTEGTLTAELLREHLFRYVLAKFGLEAAEAPSRSLEDLAEESLAKALRTDPDQVTEAERPATCDGARSVDMKQALLIMALQREFGVALDGLRAGLADTTDELADLMFAAFPASDDGAGK
ncbi:hypothetical protein [Gordonibacter urolithinfaciens]|uniref:hypothetical protein n=1 Tax=Gordonibacter urolithinfaciens TaxID=1335613 RepID=UPI003A911552